MTARLLTLAAVIAKGLIMSAVLLLLQIHLPQAVIIAAVSSTITGLFTIAAATVAARIAANAAERNRRLLHDVKRAVGADKRATDSPDA